MFDDWLKSIFQIKDMTSRITRIWIICCCILSLYNATAQQNVGIGVDTPQATLHVAGGILADSIKLPIGAAKSYILTSDSLGNGSWQPFLDLPPDLKTVSETFIAQDPTFMALNDTVAFIAHHQIGDIRSYDISTDEITELDVYNTGAFPVDLVLNGNILCGIDASLDSLYVLDVSDPNNIARRDAAALGEGSRYLAANESIAAITNFITDSLYLFDISDPDSIELISQSFIAENLASVAIEGDYVYILNTSTDGLTVVDISDPAAPIIMGFVMTGISPRYIRVSNGMAYVIDASTKELSIIDLLDPSSPYVISTTLTASAFRGFDVEDGYVFVALANDSIQIFDISDLEEPQLIGTHAGGGSMSYLEAHNSLIYLLDDGDNFIRVLCLNSTLPALGPDGNITSFDNRFMGLLEIVSPVEFDHLRLTKPGVDQVDMTIDKQDGLCFESNSGTLLYSKLENGFLGVGTRFPREKLTVNNGKIHVNSLGNTDNKGLIFSEFSFFADMGLVFDATDPGGIFTPGVKKLHFKRFGGGAFDTAAIMTITDEDFIGIGTTHPEQPLNVIGNVQVEDGLVRVREGSQDLNLVNHASSGFVQLDVGGSGHSSDDIILGDISSSVNKVGIGTSSPGSAITNAMLEVGGGHIVISNNFGFFSNNDGNNGIGAGIDTRSDDGMEFYANGSSRMTLTSIGRLGIGTSNPSEALDIVGGFQVDGSTFNVDETNNRVGIGTTSPATHLEVSSSSNPTTRITHTSNGTVRLEFKRNSGDDWRIHNTSGILLFGQSTNNLSSVTDVFRLGGGSVTPASDNAVTLGQSSRRWTAVWAVDGSINTSDARLKKDIEPIAEGLPLIQQLNPVSFKWKANQDQGRSHTGFIAQELQEVVPHLVIDHEWREVPDSDQREWVETEHLGVNYAELIPILTKAIQEQQEMIEALQEEVSELKELIMDN